MFDKIIAYSIENKFVIGLLVVALIVWGVFSLRQLPIDAVPDITNNQVQIITITPTLAAQEVEQFVTYPIEQAVTNLPDLEELRSISRFGLFGCHCGFQRKCRHLVCPADCRRETQRSRRTDSTRSWKTGVSASIHWSW